MELVRPAQVTGNMRSCESSEIHENDVREEKNKDCECLDILFPFLKSDYIV